MKKVAIIGAGPAGLTCAKQALQRDLEVTVFESQAHLGGIWNKYGRGAYPSVQMQSSRMSFHFSDYAPGDDISDFPSRDEVYDYLFNYASHFDVLSRIRFQTSVVNVEKEADQWQVTYLQGDQQNSQLFDYIMIANGELWHSNIAEDRPENPSYVLKTAKDYQGVESIPGKRVLVVGGGVSGADIAAELSEYRQVDWSVRTKRLFLPRKIGTAYNDELFSYIGRIAAQEMPYNEFLAYLTQRIPEYMAQYQKSGLVPSDTVNNAIHVNDRIVPAVAAGHVKVQPAFECLTSKGVQFVDGSEAEYDEVIFCTGYANPDYSFIADFDATDLYEHYIYHHNPTLAIINTPVRTEAFGTACPFFEMIGHYALDVFTNKTKLPSSTEMSSWCSEHLKQPGHRYYYDCWLETIRLGLMTGAIASPTENFTKFWNLVSGSVSPSKLVETEADTSDSFLDLGLDLSSLKSRLIKSLPTEVQNGLVAQGVISEGDLMSVETLPAIDANLSYPKPKL